MTNYSDIATGLTPTEFNDFSLVENDESVKQSIKNIILTKKGARTRYQNHLYGTSISELLFEKINAITSNIIRKEIELSLKNFDKRVDLMEVEVEPNEDANLYKITVYYRIKALLKEDSVTFDIEVLK